MRLGRSVRSQDEAQVDLTPMLDVVFILLIFFIVSSQFIQPSKVELQRPSTTSQQVVPDKAFTVKLLENGTYYVDENPITESALTTQLTLYKQTAQQGTFMIDADENTPTKHIVKLIDLANQVGLQQVGLVAERR